MAIFVPFRIFSKWLQWKQIMSDVVAMASFFCDLAPQLGCWLAARQMHIMMLRAVMRAPLTFFDTTPTGRIISRFAKDVDVLDTSLPQQISDSIYCLFEVIFGNTWTKLRWLLLFPFYNSFIIHWTLKYLYFMRGLVFPVWIHLNHLFILQFYIKRCIAVTLV